MQVAQISLLHAWAINQILQQWLPQVDIKLHNIAKMLEVLLETQATVQQPLNTATVAIVKRLELPVNCLLKATLVTLTLRKSRGSPLNTVCSMRHRILMLTRQRLFKRDKSMCSR